MEGFDQESEQNTNEKIREHNLTYKSGLAASDGCTDGRLAYAGNTLEAH